MNTDRSSTTAARTADTIREDVLRLVAEYAAVAFPHQPFAAGQAVPVAGRVFDAREVQRLVESALDFWLTTGRHAEEFERAFISRVGARCASLVNSGSSANLLALSALTSPTLGEQRLLPGEEVITVAAGFPTTVNPIFQNNLIPVFVDVEHPERNATYNIDVSCLDEALSSKTRAIMIAHTLGNPFHCDAVSEFCRQNDLWLIEDCCDALGATYAGTHVGHFGDLATCSFYPAHHITMGEGGIVYSQSPKLQKIVDSFRDWGRDCWCQPGHDDTCGKRFDWQLGDLPHGYDHKYVYSHIGYNLKLTDMQAAIGVAQLEKLDGFVAARRRNFNHLFAGLSRFQDIFVLPSATPQSEPSWFGFPLSVRPTAPFNRRELVQYLEKKRIGTRQLFGGNLLRQPAYQGRAFRRSGSLEAADYVMANTLWLGVFPGLSDDHIDYVIDSITHYIGHRD